MRADHGNRSSVTFYFYLHLGIWYGGLDSLFYFILHIAFPSSLYVHWVSASWEAAILRNNLSYAIEHCTTVFALHP